MASGKNMIKQIAEATSYSQKDVKTIVNFLPELVTSYISAGKSIDFGMLGRINLSTKFEYSFLIDNTITFQELSKQLSRNVNIDEKEVFEVLDFYFQRVALSLYSGEKAHVFRIVTFSFKKEEDYYYIQPLLSKHLKDNVIELVSVLLLRNKDKSIVKKTIEKKDIKISFKLNETLVKKTFPKSFMEEL